MNPTNSSPAKFQGSLRIQTETTNQITHRVLCELQILNTMQYYISFTAIVSLPYVCIHAKNYKPQQLNTIFINRMYIIKLKV